MSATAPAKATGPGEIFPSPQSVTVSFFQELKSILRKAPLIEQDEILIARSEVYLI
jgi:hypothetical protein